MTRTRRQESKTGEPSAATTPVTPAANSQAACPPFNARRSMRIAVAVAALWGCLLVGMAVFSANPVTLNRRQITHSDLVVTAEVINTTAGTVRIRKRWDVTSARTLTGESVKIEELQNTGVAEGRIYILPLKRVKTGLFRLTPIPRSSPSALIYPADDDTIEQLRSILKSVAGSRVR